MGHVREIRSCSAGGEQHGERIKESIGRREKVELADKRGDKRREKYILRIHAQPRPICLHKLPQDVLGRLVDIGATCVFWEIPFQRDLSGRSVSMSKGTRGWAERVVSKTILPLRKGEAAGMKEKGLSDSGGERMRMRLTDNSGNNGERRGERPRNHTVDGTYLWQLVLEHINLVQEKDD